MPSDDAEPVVDGGLQLRAVEGAVGLLRNCDEPSDHGIGFGHDRDEVLDIGMSTDQLGIQDDVAPTKSNVPGSAIAGVGWPPAVPPGQRSVGGAH